MADSEDSEQTYSPNIPHWYTPTEDILTLVDGDSAMVYDDQGDEYLDFISQLYCVNAGHGNENIRSRMEQQLERIQHVSPSKNNDKRSELSVELTNVAPDNLTDVVFSVSGSEANEIAIQIAQSYKDASKVLTRWQSYHGATYGAGALTGDPSTRSTIESKAATTGYAKFLPPLTTNDAFDADSDADLARKASEHLEFVIRDEGPDSIAAVMMEPIGGTSGAYPAPAGYFQRVREICSKFDILHISDEVITGFGRCGSWFGIQTEDVQPDMITFAKGCTIGYAPLAGTLVDSDISKFMRSEGFEIGQTFSGHPVSCAAGLGALEVYEDELIDNVNRLEPYFEQRLSDLSASFDVIGEARGRGFLWAVTFEEPTSGDPFVDPRMNENDDNPVTEIRRAVLDHGVILGSGRPNHQLILAPPFTVEKEDINRAVDALAKATRDVLG